MGAVRELLGTVACFNPNCGVDVPVKKSAGGAVAVCCPYCDLQAYGKEGTQSKAHILALMRPLKGAPEPATETPEPMAKPVKKPSTIFG